MNAPLAREALPFTLSLSKGLDPVALQRYLRALWNTAPPLHFDAEVPFIADRAIHLAAGGADTAWPQHCAAAAHAAAHLVYSPAVFDGRGLRPIVRALLGLLEDARVEALACRELPGLQRLWLPLHTATPLDGEGFEALMARLARALIDARYDDPHPWVRKGRTLFFLDEPQQVLALCQPDALRHAASLLGNDIGQMRLQFNARLYRPSPAYRDDHRWMWPAGESPEAPPPEPVLSGAGTGSEPEPVFPTPPEHYPEWDRLIARLRPKWCAVFEQPARDEAEPSMQPQAPWRSAIGALGARATSRAHSDHDGAQFDLDALVRARVAQRLRRPADPRVYRRPEPPRRGRAVLLIDQSSSTAGAWGESGISLLQAACESAAASAHALQATGLRCAVFGFCSNGRAAVQLQRIKGFDGKLDQGVLARLAALRSGQSTRLGAALRHGVRRLGHERGERLVLLLSDGLPHDVDVHDPRYLVDDARHAVRQAARQGVRMICLALDPAGASTARRIFGTRGVAVLDRIERLPALLRQLTR